MGRLNLGKPGRVLMAFMCNHNPGDCETWKIDVGANAVLVMEENALGSGLTSAPECGAKTEVEAFIVSWRLGEDAVPEPQEAAFFDEHKRDALPYETRDAVYNTTKLGGLPAWVQFPEGPAVPPFRFAGQFNGELIFSGAAAVRQADVLSRLPMEPDNERTRNRTPARGLASPTRRSACPLRLDG